MSEKAKPWARECGWLEDLEDLMRGTRLEERFQKSKGIAILSGPAVCIEVIVRKAEKDSGIPMDWGYIGGRAVVHALGDAETARQALRFAIPQHNLQP